MKQNRELYKSWGLGKQVRNARLAHFTASKHSATHTIKIYLHIIIDSFSHISPHSILFPFFSRLKYRKYRGRKYHRVMFSVTRPNTHFLHNYSSILTGWLSENLIYIVWLIRDTYIFFFSFTFMLASWISVFLYFNLSTIIIFFPWNLSLVSIFDLLFCIPCLRFRFQTQLTGVYFPSFKVIYCRTLILGAE